MRRFSITDKLIVTAFVISVSIIAIVASFSFYRAKDAMLDRSFNQLNSVRVVKTNLLESFFHNSEKDIRLAAASSDIQGVVGQMNGLANSDGFHFVGDTLFDVGNLFVNEISKENYSSIYIIGQNKLVYPLKLNREHSVDYSLLWEETIQSDSVLIRDFVKTDGANKFNLTVSKKILDALNQPIGIIVFEILPSAIDAIMLNNAPANGFGTSGESYLVGDDFLMRSSSRFQEHSILNTLVQTDAVHDAFANEAGNKVIKDYRDVKVLSSYSQIKIPNLHWAIFVEIDFKEVTVPIYKIRSEIIFISIFIFFIVLVAIIVLSRKITHPIEKLNQAAHEVGIGNLDVEIHSSSDDEIGELTETFNQMVEKLRKQTKELEIERTKSLRSVFDGQEAERQRLSRELHDSLGQLLIGLKLKYESYINQAKLKSDEFSELSLLFDQTIEETRRISNNLMPAALSEFGLTTSVRNICNEITETTDINIKYEVEGSGKGLTLEMTTYLFRIIQEGLTNIVKHSQAQNAGIYLAFRTKIITVKIEDDGCGFDPLKTKPAKSNGLNNIKDRVGLLSGHLEIVSKIQQGTKLIIEIPIKNKES